jgi:hypothetical protein
LLVAGAVGAAYWHQKRRRGRSSSGNLYANSTEANLGKNWVEKKDDQYNTYWLNSQTGKIVYTRPGVVLNHNSMGQQEKKEKKKQLPPGWQVVHSKNDNIPYYFHTETGKTQWDPPPSTSSRSIPFKPVPPSMPPPRSGGGAGMAQDDSLSRGATHKFQELEMTGNGNTCTRTDTKKKAPSLPPRRS